MDAQTIVLILPLIILELVLKVICFKDWYHRDRFKGVPKSAWLLIFLFINLFGPVLYLLYGRKTDGDD